MIAEMYHYLQPRINENGAEAISLTSFFISRCLAMPFPSTDVMQNIVAGTVSHYSPSSGRIKRKVRKT